MFSIHSKSLSRYDDYHNATLASGGQGDGDRAAHILKDRFVSAIFFQLFSCLLKIFLISYYTKEDNDDSALRCLSLYSFFPIKPKSHIFFAVASPQLQTDHVNAEVCCTTIAVSCIFAALDQSGRAARAEKKFKINSRRYRPLKYKTVHSTEVRMKFKRENDVQAVCDSLFCHFSCIS